MRLLLRFVPFVFLVGLACYSFYSLGKRRGTKDRTDASGEGHRKRKVVDSSVIEDERL
jgi:hypothetical protein